MTGRWKRWLLGGALALALSCGVLGYQAFALFSSVPHLFKRNAELKAAGYYMAEFEFKLLSVLKQLSDGAYIDATLTMRRIAREMETTEGLVRQPAGASPEARMAFLLDRQDAKTGAFMNSDYPAFTYIAPTLNVVEALETLARQTGQPLKLKYPLSFLDNISDPKALRAYLNGLLYASPLWADRFPGPGAYGPGVSELAAYDLFERTGLYRFSPAWKAEFRAWLDATQDPATGRWGARVGTPDRWVPRGDPNSTFHILGLILDREGNDRDPAHPLNHAGALARTMLKTMAAPIPDGEDAQHAWGLDQAQATQTLVRLLWGHLGEVDRDAIRTVLASALEQRYRLFRPDRHAFAIYLASSTADIDGTSTALGLIKATGSIPGTRERRRLWGEVSFPEAATENVATPEDIAFPAAPAINAFRLYADAIPPGDDLDDGRLLAIVYPRDRRGVLDVMDLRQNIDAFLFGGATGFGNWASVASLREGALGLAAPVRQVPVFTGRADVNALARGRTALTVVGYDVFQRPVSVRIYHIGA